MINTDNIILFTGKSILFTAIQQSQPYYNMFSMVTTIIPIEFSTYNLFIVGYYLLLFTVTATG